MASNTINLDTTSGAFVSTSDSPYSLTSNTGGTYGTTSPAPYSGAGRLQLSSGHSIVISKNGSAVNGSQGIPTWIDFMAYIVSPITQLGKFAGGFYYSTSAAVGCNASGSFGQIHSGSGFTIATGNVSIPTGEWVRFAWKHHGSSPSNYGESRMFKGANLLGTVPDASVPSDSVPADGIAFIGPSEGWNQSLFIDSVIMSDEGWPTRGGAPSFNPSVAGQHNF